MPPIALLPRQPVPALNVPLTTGGRFVLGAEPGKVFDLLVFYRGLHCPICAKYLLELERLAPDFAQRGSIGGAHQAAATSNRGGV